MLMNKTYSCSVSGKPIPETRVEALQSLGIPTEQWTCIEHSNTKRLQGIYFGNHGSGQLVIAKSISDHETMEPASE